MLNERALKINKSSITLEKAMKELTKQWIEKATENEQVAKILMQKEFPHHAVLCFHLQQATEKFVKALLIEQDVAFGRTYKIDKLIKEKLVDKYPEFSQYLSGAKKLSNYAVAPRYPNNSPQISNAETLQALEHFEQIKAAVFTKLHT